MGDSDALLIAAVIVAFVVGYGVVSVIARKLLPPREPDPRDVWPARTLYEEPEEGDDRP